jgi:RNA polymerase sigma-70 factor (ECF subfamily)
VVQETFLAAARGDVRYDASRGSARSWLCGIARRQVALYFRQRRRSLRMLEADDPRGEQVRRQVVDWLEGRVELPEAALARRETAAIVRHVIGELSELHSTVLIMHYLEELSVEEIARSEQSSAAAIRSRLARAREAFRAMLTSRSPSTIDADTGAAHHG